MISFCRPLLIVGLVVPAACAIAQKTSNTINRSALVARHNVHKRVHDPLLPITVGNGDFAYTLDVTGTQSFPEAHETTGIPLSTLSNWGWHHFPNRENHQPSDVLEPWDTYGRPVPYPTLTGTKAAVYLQANPHRLDLGEVGFLIQRVDGTTATLSDITSIDQQLDLMSGTVRSSFVVEGYPVEVKTCVHPTLDCLALQVDSQLVMEKRLHIRLRFSYPGDQPGQVRRHDLPGRHTSTLMEPNRGRFIVRRQLDMYRYGVAFTSFTSTTVRMSAAHEVLVSPIGESPILDFACHFAGGGDPLTQLPDAEPTFVAAAEHWKNFWYSGGAVDFSGSTDPRSAELERRIVLSQYLTAVQCGGLLPPDVTGLTSTHEFGKFNTTMHWPLAAHFAIWGRPDILARSAQWYMDILPKAEEAAKHQGYAGARWPSIAGPDGRQNPGTTKPLILSHQAHPIYFAEILYQAEPTPQTLRKHAKVVSRTAEFMASFLHFDKAAKEYVLGPPVAVPFAADPGETKNPSLELAYWKWAIRTARDWQIRAVKPVEPKWDEILERISALPVKDGMYAPAEVGGSAKNPASLMHLMIFGMLPPPKHDQEVLHHTLQTLWENWNWSRGTALDLAAFSMAAARAGKRELALEVLLKEIPANHCLANGHFQQLDGRQVFLPANGALLSAIAIMLSSQGTQSLPETWKITSEGICAFP